LQSIDNCILDLSQLVRGKALTFPCTISKNGLGIKSNALIDTGANGFIFIDTNLAKKAVQFLLDSQIRPLPKAFFVKGFDGRQTLQISQYLELNLHIDGRMQIKLPMLLVELGSREIIVGRSWLAKYQVLVDCHNHQLLWPDELPQNRVWNRVIATHQKNLFPPVDQIHQADSIRRDQLIEKDTWKPQRILQRSGSTWKSNQTAEYKKMAMNLNWRQPAEEKSQIRATKSEPKPELVDICGISAAAFRLHLKKPNNTFFAASLDEIDAILESRKEPEELGQVPLTGNLESQN
jgi:hypothetical protein